VRTGSGVSAGGLDKTGSVYIVDCGNAIYQVFADRGSDCKWDKAGKQSEHRARFYGLTFGLISTTHPPLTTPRMYDLRPDRDRS
jgi:hypothetical protein